MIIGIPALNQHEMTLKTLSYLKDSVQSVDNVKVVIIDNASYPIYGVDLGNDFPFPVSVLRNNENLGFYYPILQLYSANQQEDIIAVMHNDVFIYEYGWDERLRYYFESDPKLGIVGFCGSPEIDILGGRGGGTMCNFRGEQGQLQEHTGKKIDDLRPALILDSMFMAFRTELIPKLGIDETITPAHFYDKILPMRAVEAGNHVAVLGVEIDHMGGTTLVGEPAFELAMRHWCQKQGLQYGENAGAAVYMEAERRWLEEYRDKKGMIPLFVDENYAVYRT